MGSITVCNSPTQCVLNTLKFAHVEPLQTVEEKVAVVQTTTRQGIFRQASSLICQILSDLSEFTHLNEAILTNIADMVNKGILRHQGSLQQLMDV